MSCLSIWMMPVPTSAVWWLATVPLTWAQPLAPPALRAQRSPDPACETGSLVVRLASPDMVRVAGIAYVPAEGTVIPGQAIVRPGVVAFDPARVTRITSPVSGRVRQVRCELGQPVARHESLVEIESAELAQASADLLAAVDNLHRREALAEQAAALTARGAATDRELLDAQADLTAARLTLDLARQRLRVLGLDESDLTRIQRDRSLASTLGLRAPAGGLVLERLVNAGDRVEAGQLLAVLVDPSRVWIMLNLDEGDMARVSAGQEVDVHTEGLPEGVRPRGVITGLSPRVEPRTRVIRAIAAVDNPGGFLRADALVRATIWLSPPQTGVIVPRDAVQWEGCCNVVFVPQDETTFRPVPVRLITPDPRTLPATSAVTVLGDLTPGQMVVSAGAFFLRTEILRGSIGAGCCDVGHLAR